MNGSITIPFFGVARQYQTLREELLEAIDWVYSSGQVLDGVNTKHFETAIAHRCGRQFSVAVNSCTQGLILAQSVCIPRASKVLIPTLSFAATINSVLMAGHEPVFCDTDQNGLIDLESLDFALTGAGVNSILYANLWGHVIDWQNFKIHTEFFNEDMFVIEDAAQSFGAYYHDTPSGKLGDVSVLSFDPTKNLNNYGSGGMILTDDPVIYEALRDVRDNGKYKGHDFPGTNSKMSESDCAQMLIKLKYFNQWQRRRTEIAEYYMEEQLVKDYTRRGCFDHVIIRPSAVYGEYDVEDRVVSKFMLSAMRGETLKVNGANETLDFTYVEDAARGIVQATLSDSAVNNTYNITKSHSMSLLQAASLAIKIAGQGDIECRDKDADFPSRGALNIDRARQDFGFDPKVDVEEGFQKYYEWFTTSPYWQARLK